MDIYLDSFDPVKSVSPAGIFTNRVEVSCDQQFLLIRYELNMSKQAFSSFPTAYS